MTKHLSKFTSISTDAFLFALKDYFLPLIKLSSFINSIGKLSNQLSSSEKMMELKMKEMEQKLNTLNATYSMLNKEIKEIKTLVKQIKSPTVSVEVKPPVRKFADTYVDVDAIARVIAEFKESNSLVPVLVTGRKPGRVGKASRVRFMERQQQKQPVEAGHYYPKKEKQKLYQAALGLANQPKTVEVDNPKSESKKALTSKTKV